MSEEHIHVNHSGVVPHSLMFRNQIVVCVLVFHSGVSQVWGDIWVKLDTEV